MDLTLSRPRAGGFRGVVRRFIWIVQELTSSSDPIWQHNWQDRAFTRDQLWPCKCTQYMLPTDISGRLTYLPLGGTAVGKQLFWRRAIAEPYTPMCDFKRPNIHLPVESYYKTPRNIRWSRCLLKVLFYLPRQIKVDYYILARICLNSCDLGSEASGT